MRTKPFAQTLLAWRRKQKLNRAEACRRFNVPYRTWQDWERETHTPNQFARAMVLDLIGEKKLFSQTFSIVSRGTGRKTLGKPTPKK